MTDYLVEEEYGIEKPKRVAYPLDRPYPDRVVQMTAWLMVGMVGLALSIGSVVVALAEHGTPAVMLIPLIFMTIAMKTVRGLGG